MILLPLYIKTEYEKLLDKYLPICFDLVDDDKYNMWDLTAFADFVHNTFCYTLDRFAISHEEFSPEIIIDVLLDYHDFYLLINNKYDYQNVFTEDSVLDILSDGYEIEWDRNVQIIESKKSFPALCNINKENIYNSYKETFPTYSFDDVNNNIYNLVDVDSLSLSTLSPKEIAEVLEEILWQRSSSGDWVELSRTDFAKSLKFMLTHDIDFDGNITSKEVENIDKKVIKYLGIFPNNTQFLSSTSQISDLYNYPASFSYSTNGLLSGTEGVTLFVVSEHLFGMINKEWKSWSE